MFVISGKPDAWRVEKVNDRDFCVINTKCENVNLKVNVPEKGFIISDIDMTRPLINQDIFPYNLIIKYDNKTLKPEAFCIGERKGTKAVLAAVSIDIPEGYRVTSIYNSNARIYSKDFDPESHLYFIGNFGITREDNPRTPIINVTAVNFKSYKVINYIIRYDKNNDRISFNSRRYNFEDIPKQGERGHIRLDDFISKYIQDNVEVFPLYYPSSPTSLIVSAEENLDPLTEIIQDKSRHWRRIQNYILKESVTIDDIENYINNGYTAITVYFNKILEAEELDEYSWIEYLGNTLGNKIMDSFRTVYLIDATGKLYKIKLNDKLIR